MASARNVSLPVRLLVTVGAFLLAVRLLGAATATAAPAVAPLLRSASHANALGLGWLAAYALANGSVVAAVGLSLFAAGALGAGQLFFVVAGSRLGAAAVVVLVGAMYYAQRRRGRLREAVSLGLLAFLVTHTVYLPATALGALALAPLEGRLAARAPLDAGTRPVGPLAALARAVVDAVGPFAAGALAVALLFAALRLFDQVLAGAESAATRRLLGRLERVWVSFLAGLAVTALATSVAFSLGAVVPLFNRGYVERDDLVPYVLGANLGTLADSLLVAAVLGTPTGGALVLVLVAAAGAVTVAALVRVGGYRRAVATAHDRLLRDPRALAGFAVLLIVVPVALLAL